MLGDTGGMAMATSVCDEDKRAQDRGGRKQVEECRFIGVWPSIRRGSWPGSLEYTRPLIGQQNSKPYPSPIPRPAAHHRQQPAHLHVLAVVRQLVHHTAHLERLITSVLLHHSGCAITLRKSNINVRAPREPPGPLCLLAFCLLIRLSRPPPAMSRRNEDGLE